MKLFSGVPDPIPRIVTRFSKPAVFVACKPGTVEFRLVMVFAKDLSRESADKDVIAIGAFWISTLRRSAVTTISDSALASVA